MSIVSQDDEGTMVVRPSDITAHSNTGKKSTPKQFNLWGKPVTAPATQTVEVKAHTRKDGTYVPTHLRFVKANKSAAKPRNAKKGRIVPSKHRFGNTTCIFKKSDLERLDKKTKQEAFSVRLNEMLALTRKSFNSSTTSNHPTTNK